MRLDIIYLAIHLSEQTHNIEKHFFNINKLIMFTIHIIYLLINYHRDTSRFHFHPAIGQYTANNTITSWGF